MGMIACSVGKADFWPYFPNKLLNHQMTECNYLLPYMIFFFFAVKQSWIYNKIIDPLSSVMRQKDIHEGFKALSTFYLVSIKFAISILQG